MILEQRNRFADLGVFFFAFTDLKQLSTRQEEELNSLSATRSATPEILTRDRGDSGVKLQEEITDVSFHLG